MLRAVLAQHLCYASPLAFNGQIQCCLPGVRLGIHLYAGGQERLHHLAMTPVPVVVRGYRMKRRLSLSVPGIHIPALFQQDLDHIYASPQAAS